MTSTGGRLLLEQWKLPSVLCETVGCHHNIAAATAAGLYESMHEAQQTMGSGFERTYTPDPEKAKKYERLYEKYIKLGRFVEDELTG